LIGTKKALSDSFYYWPLVKVLVIKHTQKDGLMTIQHIKSSDTWLVSKGQKILYRGPVSPLGSSRILAVALKRDGLKIIS